MKNQTENLDILHIKFEYAWNWFSYHANQRLIAFRFYLIIVGLISIAYYNCLIYISKSACVLIGIFGFIISIMFYLLDIRNLELVTCGRNALDKFEKEIGMSIRNDDFKRKFYNGKLKRVVKHTFIFRSLFLILSIIFIFSIIYPLTIK